MSSAGYTIGRAFSRAWWLTVLVDVVVLGASLWAAWSFAQGIGVLSAAVAWGLAMIFSEMNAGIMVLLDRLGVTAQQYVLMMMQLWGFKLVVVLLLGGLFVRFAPYNLTVFCFVLVFSVLVATVKNAVIGAFARIL